MQNVKHFVKEVKNYLTNAVFYDIILCIKLICYQIRERVSIMDKNIDIEILAVDTASEKPVERRGGKRPGAGRPALVRLNKERMAQGLEPILPKQSINKKVTKRKSDAILPQSKKARAQEVLAEMLGRKSKYIVQKVLDKALDDEDKDQMACLQLVMDRVLPKDYITKAKGNGNQISIQIIGVGETTINAEENDDVVDAEFEEVDDNITS